jgi:hypothetical protein
MMVVRPNSYRTVLWIIAVLLLLTLLSNVFSIVTTYQKDKLEQDRAATYQARVEEAKTIVNMQRDIIDDLVSDYEEDAYDNPLIDRIAEQQLLAAEYQMLALQTLAIQNSQIIEFLSATP